MDPVTIAAAVLSVAVLLNNLTRFTKQLAQVDDPKLKLLKARLFLQQRKLLQWSQDLNIHEIEDIKDRVHADDLKLVCEYWQSINKYFEEASKRVNRINDQSPRKLKGYIERLQWLNGGYHDLKILVETVEILISTLWEIAKPPPKYHAENSPSADQYDIRESLSPPLSTTNQSGLSSEYISDYDVATPEHWTSIGSPQITMSTLHRTCYETMNIVACHVADMEQFRELVWRLKVWANNILEGPFSVDIVLAKKQDGQRIYSRLHDAMIATFVEMIYMQQQVLHCLAKQSLGKKHYELESKEVQLIALLCSDGIAKIAFDQPYQSSSAFDDNETSAVVEQAVQCFRQATDSLYQLSPVIRSIRRQSMLEHEIEIKLEKSERINEAISQTTVEVAHSDEKDWLAQVRESAADCRRQLEIEETNVAKAGIPITIAYSKELGKQIARLEEFGAPIRKEEAERLVKELIRKLDNMQPVYKTSKQEMSEKDILKLKEERKMEIDDIGRGIDELYRYEE